MPLTRLRYWWGWYTNRSDAGRLKVMPMVSAESERKGCIDLKWHFDSPSIYRQHNLGYCRIIVRKAAEKFAARRVNLITCSFPIDVSISRIITCVRWRWILLNVVLCLIIIANTSRGKKSKAKQLHHLHRTLRSLWWRPLIWFSITVPWPQTSSVDQRTKEDFGRQTVCLLEIFSFMNRRIALDTSTKWILEVLNVSCRSSFDLVCRKDWQMLNTWITYVVDPLFSRSGKLTTSGHLSVRCVD